MITVTNIKEYLYCPEKLNLRLENLDITTEEQISGKISKEAFKGFDSIVQRNLWVLNGKMNIRDILNELFKDMPSFLDTIYRRYQEEGIEDPSPIFESLKEDMRFNSWLIAIKTQKLLNDGINGSEAVKILYPPSFIEFKIENPEVGLVGMIDKIEIIDGTYYPIAIKTNLPPLNGVWESDAIQSSAYSFLMEEEFNKDVAVGFINYTKIGSKQPVVNSPLLTNKFIEIFEKLCDMIYEGKKPEIHININKCRLCEYSTMCSYCNQHLL
ncbi:RecB family exonuclease [Methanobacterium lacus]|uniref:RecB family exonuclease n=1 Tax=Methanobacterium lacus (strain AL-21) TaxID=877455 RepID=F0T8C7_METLA|nr:Dna2/Cas4 domain-containing protein [Methanobacterium lacus]ADZ08539.1 RecB family exonuclease [Methanobacterium lacus]